MPFGGMSGSLAGDVSSQNDFLFANTPFYFTDPTGNLQINSYLLSSPGAGNTGGETTVTVTGYAGDVALATDSGTNALTVTGGNLVDGCSFTHDFTTEGGIQVAYAPGTCVVRVLIFETPSGANHVGIDSINACAADLPNAFPSGS